MVAEGIVLLGIEYLHQSRRRVSAEVAAEFIHLIQHADGIVGLGTLQALDDLSRQSADVRAAMSADFRFIVHAAQCQPHKFSSQSASDGFA